jgi:methionyl-tRNA formyltransferase
MKMTSKKIVFFGNERLATGVRTTAPTLQALIQAGYEIVTVISNYTNSSSRNVRTLEIKDIAEQHNIPVMLPNKPSEVESKLRELNAEIGVLVAYGKIVPQSIIELFPGGIVNIHPSLLPLHRGPTPIESVILNGEKETGVSLMQLVKEMDAGPVYAQESIALTGSETKLDLAAILLETGKELLIRSLPKIIDGSLVPFPQEDTKATYDALIGKEDSIIDWQKPANRIEREIRAYAEWPKSRTTLAGKEVIVTKAHVDQGQNSTAGRVFARNGHLGIYCKDGALIIDSLKPAGKPEMSAAAFIAGYGRMLG